MRTFAGAQSAVPSPLPTIPLTHQYNHSLTAAPNPLTITAGFSRLVTLTARDEAATLFTLVPDTATLNGNIGTRRASRACSGRPSRTVSAATLSF